MLKKISEKLGFTTQEKLDELKNETNKISNAHSIKELELSRRIETIEKNNNASKDIQTIKSVENEAANLSRQIESFIRDQTNEFESMKLTLDGLKEEIIDFIVPKISKLEKQLINKTCKTEQKIDELKNDLHWRIDGLDAKKNSSIDGIKSLGNPVLLTHGEKVKAVSLSMNLDLPKNKKGRKLKLEGKENEILELIQQGHSPKHIGKHFGVSRNCARLFILNKKLKSKLEEPVIIADSASKHKKNTRLSYRKKLNGKEQKIIKLFKKKVAPLSIAKIMDVPKYVLERFVKEKGIEKPIYRRDKKIVTVKSTNDLEVYV